MISAGMVGPKLMLFSGAVLALFSWSRFVQDTGVTSQLHLHGGSTSNCGGSSGEDVRLNELYRFPFRKEWARVIDDDLAEYVNDSRVAIFKAAWLTGGREVGATFQITSDKMVSIAPPARPWTFSQLTNDELTKYSQRTLMFATMLQLMLSRMDEVPNVTIVVRYDENCFRQYTDDKVLNQLDYSAMQEESPWDEWLGDRKKVLEDRSDTLPYFDVAKVVYWHRPNDPEPSLNCRGTLMPGPESMYQLRLDDGDSSASSSANDDSHHMGVPWNQRVEKLFWRGSISEDSTPLPSALIRLEDLKKVSIRARVVDAAHRLPHLFDIKLVGNASENDMFPGFYDDRSTSDQAGGENMYKYQLNVDSVGPDTRLFDQLMSGSLIFKLESPFKTFATLDMKPWVHYVPISWSELEWVKEMEVMLRWAVSNDEVAHKIADTGRRYALERYTYDNAAWFMGQVAKKMARQQQSEPFERIPGSRPFCCAHLKHLSEELSSKAFWVEKCEEWTKGWVPKACFGADSSSDTDINPADVSQYTS